MNTLIVERFTAEPVCTLFDATPEDVIKRSGAVGIDFKPLGTWVSVPSDRDWPKWAGPVFGYETLRYRHTFSLDMSRVLHIDTERAFDAFHREFAKPSPLTEILLAPDWPEVMRRYAGIVIAPYMHRRRHDHFWYSPWDCSSGCIWKTSVLTPLSSELSGLER